MNVYRERAVGMGLVLVGAVAALIENFRSSPNVAFLITGILLGLLGAAMLADAGEED